MISLSHAIMSGVRGDKVSKLQSVLIICVFILVGMVFYSYWSGNDLGWYLKGWLTLCSALYIIRLVEKYRKKETLKQQPKRLLF